MLTSLAALLVLFALTTPSRVEDVGPAAYARLPLEALVYLAIVLALPPRLGRVRTVLAVVAGVLLALAAVSRVLDMGFLEALNRPFDPLIDWHYAGSLVETLRSAVGDRLGTTLLVVAVLLVWMWLMSLAILVGAELNAQLEGLRDPDDELHD